MNNLIEKIKLRDDNINCDRCYLRNMESRPICSLASGRVFIVGQTPGSDEDLVWAPFSGREGQFYRKFFRQLFNEKEIHYTYLIKCFPNEKSVKQSCRMTCANLWLTKEIEYADPDIIICLAAPIFKILTGKKHSGIPCFDECQERSIILVDGAQKLNKKSIYNKNLAFIKKVLGL